MPPAADLFAPDAKLVEKLSQQLIDLPQIVRFISDKELVPELREFSPDPAMRDVQLETLLNFAPTGRRGIHTLEIGSRSAEIVSLSQRERVVLREAVKWPTAQHTQYGSFVGHAREVDLDKTRIHLRNVHDVGTLRCVVPKLKTQDAKALLGGLVKAEGRYQTDRSGRPRLLLVETIIRVENRQNTLPL